ncbi:hypothetical protein [Silvibacterium acidisoli]|uniref:hypothetical protein n=1 Tax=Acidobacteriaceae bacterium ZG23-2 TaxID=2883246 RepID=UPI00406CC596
MATLVEQIPIAKEDAPAQPSRTQAAARPTAFLAPWLRSQSINVNRHAAALRPFKVDEFGSGAEAPTPGHLQVVNELITQLRGGLLKMSGKVGDSVAAALQEPTTARLQDVMRKKERAHTWVRGIEKIWDFYFEVFGQRQSRFAKWLLSCDRIGLDCYRTSYLGLAVARSIPAPPPFSYVATGFSPATFRRGIPLRRLGKQLNPFPLIQLPYHRLVNPWTLGGVLHEVSHNLQNDLGLARDVPRSIGLALLRAGASRKVARIWVRWNREMFSDMAGLLLGGPSFAASSMDILARGPEATVHYSSRGPHPTPYLRMLINAELLRRMGFESESRQIRNAWMRIYPKPSSGNIPAELMKTFAEACPIAVNAVCYQPYKSLGNRSLSKVMSFGHKEQQMIEEASRRLAAGVDPGIIPERFLIGAVRLALDRRHARPEVLTRNFFKALASG